MSGRDALHEESSLSHDYVESATRVLRTAILKQLRVARLVKHGDNYDAIFTDIVKERIREPVNQNPSKGTVNNLKGKRPFLR